MLFLLDLSDYRLDFYFSELLTMTVALTRVLATLHLENDDLVTLYEWVHYFTHYFCSIYGGSTYLHCTVSIYEQYLVKFNSLACLNILDVVHEELLALLGLELLTLNFYNCVHFAFYLYLGFFPRGGIRSYTLNSAPTDSNGVQRYKLFCLQLTVYSLQVITFIDI